MKPRSLIDLDIEEVSLVDKAANRKKFYIVKEDNPMDELIQLIKDIFGDEDEEMNSLVEDLEKKKDKIPDKAVEALKGAYKILNKYKDDFPDDIKGALKTLSKYATGKGYPYPKPYGKSEEGELSLDDLQDIEKAGKKLSKATIDELKKAMIIIRQLVGEKENELKKGKSSDVDWDNLPAPILAKMEKLQKLEEKEEKEEEKKRYEELEKNLTENIKDALIKELTEKGVSKQGNKGKDKDNEGDDDSGEDKWPSLG